MEIMSSIFTGICIKTINGINIIEVSEDIFNLRSSNWDVNFSNNDTYNTLRSLCKAFQSLSTRIRKKLNYLTTPVINISKYSRIYSISTNPIKYNIRIFRLRNVNANLRG